MVAVANNFEAGTNGTTITTANAGGSGNTNFDFVTIGTGATCTFDNTQAHGALSMGCNAGASGNDSGVEWSTAVGSLGTWWMRCYYYATVHPTTHYRMMDAVNAAATALCSGVYHQSDGTLVGADAGFNIACQTVGQVPLNQWVRIEMKTIGSATVGQIEVRYFAVPDAPNATEAVASAANRNTTGSAGIYRFGLHGDGPYDANKTIWVDDAAVSSVTWLGPSVRQPVRSGPPQSIVRAGWW
jgi:hypothetical protein